MKIVNKFNFSVVILLSFLFIECKEQLKHSSNNAGDTIKKSIITKPMILNVDIEDKKITKAKVDSSNWKILKTDSINYLLYSIKMPFSKNNIFIKKEFTPLETNLEFTCRADRNQIILIIVEYNYASTFLQDSIIFNKVDEALKPHAAFYTEYSERNQNTYCNYNLGNSDTIDLRQQMIDTANCKNNFQDSFVKIIYGKPIIIGKKKNMTAQKNIIVIIWS